MDKRKRLFVCMSVCDLNCQYQSEKWTLKYRAGPPASGLALGYLTTAPYQRYLESIQLLTLLVLFLQYF